MKTDDALDILVAFALHAPKLLMSVLEGKPDAEVRRLNELVGRKIQERARQAAVMATQAKAEPVPDLARELAEKAIAAALKAERQEAGYEHMLRARQAFGEPKAEDLN